MVRRGRLRAALLDSVRALVRGSRADRRSAPGRGAPRRGRRLVSRSREPQCRDLRSDRCGRLSRPRGNMEAASALAVRSPAAERGDRGGWPPTRAAAASAGDVPPVHVLLERGGRARADHSVPALRAAARRATASGGASLPADYVAAKFYFSQSFPDTPENRAFVQRAIASAAEQAPVVVLNAGARLDDHHDALISATPGVQVLHADVRDNLAAQSAVVARARGFIGTYGGFSYLAPLYGVDSLSFFSARDKLVPFHLEHAQRVYGSRPGGRFLAVDTADARALSLSFGRAQAVVE